MKIIFSRKGFDSATGGCPSPVLPSGKMLALPIPDPDSPTRYAELRWTGTSVSVAQLVTDLTRDRIKPDAGAHLDPDLRAGSLEARPAGWRPLFGQIAAAQGHLRNHGVGPGDIFLFFGLFREVEEADGRFRFRRDRAPFHSLWGWLQIDALFTPDDTARSRYPWSLRHPHWQRTQDGNNTIYLSADRLVLPDAPPTDIPGAGVFARYDDRLRLSAPDGKPGLWRLPAWFHPQGRRSVLSYHDHPDRWRRHHDNVILQVVCRGQEFVLNADDYPESISWTRSLLEETA